MKRKIGVYGDEEQRKTTNDTFATICKYFSVENHFIFVCFEKNNQNFKINFWFFWQYIVGVFVLGAIVLEYVLGLFMHVGERQ